MAVRKKLWIIVGVTVAALIGLLWVAGRWLVITSFREAEVNTVTRTATYALEQLKTETTRFRDATARWARSDEAYRYVEGQLPDFPRDYLTDATLQSFRLNLAVILDNESNLLFSSAYGAGGQSEATLLGDVQAMIAAGDSLFQMPDASIGTPAHTASSAGLLMLPDGPMLVARAPVLPASGLGPVTGIAVWGRYLTDAELGRLFGLAEASVRIYRANSPALPVVFTTVSYRPEAYSLVVLNSGSSDRMAGYIPLRDVHDRPVAYLEVMPSESVLRLAEGAFQKLILMVSAAIVLSGVAALYTSERLLAKAPSTILVIEAGSAEAMADMGETVEPVTGLGPTSG